MSLYGSRQEAVKINTVDGKILAQMMISGANNLYNNKKTVDDLNVFPVPDGDTGTNMSMTVTAMAKALEEVVSASASNVADAASYATLRGARGNSGVILSQFFRGIAKELKGKNTCTTSDFAQALKRGSDAAYKAVMNPTEGTILTVSRETAKGAIRAAEAGQDFTEVLQKAVQRGNRALEKTPEQLPMLKQAGVVDAGGQGWMFFLEGVLFYFINGKTVENAGGALQESMTSKGHTRAQQAIDSNHIKYRYCTEFIVEKKKPDVNVVSFRKAIETKGDSMLVIDDDDIVKVHIHTNNPGYVLERAVMLGSMINIKIDNMAHQHQSLIQPEKPAPKPEIKRAEHKPYAFVGVCVGDGIQEIFKNLGMDEIITGGQTMNPSTEDILKAISRLNADTVFVFPNNKNIILAANQAKDIAKEHVVVIPAKSIPQCVAAMLAFNGEKDAAANEKAMTAAAGRVKTGQVTYAVRDTEIDGRKIAEGDILGMFDKDIAVTGNSPYDVCSELIGSMTDEDSEFLTVYYGEDVAEEDAQKLEQQLSGQYDDLEVSVQYGGQALYYYIISVE